MLHRIERSHRLIAVGVAAAAVALSGLHIARANTAPGVVEDHHGPTASKADAANYTAEIVASGAYKAGAEGTVQVSVVPKGGYHINPDYPYKFKANAPGEGLTYPKPLLQRADGKFEETRGSFQVPFVAAKAGKVTVGGTLNLSVCSAANCVVDKVPLELVVDVK